MVGTTGFEPATSRTPSVRATRLRYVPTLSTPLSVSLVFEKGQDSEQFFLQIEEQFAVEARTRLGRSDGLRGMRAFSRTREFVPVCGWLLGQMLAGACNCKALLVEQALDFKHNL